MEKRGQAAMEFLMTYGWAILVVIAAIAALAYFGVLSPDKMLPERTTFQAPIPNVDNAVVEADGTVIIAFKNNVGFPINITNVTGDADGDCSNIVANSKNVSIEGGAWGPVPVSTLIRNGEGFRVRFDCGTFSTGDKFDSDITLRYVNTETSQEHPHTGSINAKVA